MKKNLFYYLFAVICSVALFTSCSDDDDEKMVNPVPQTTFTGENGLQLTYNGAPMPGKKVTFTPDATNAQKATLRLEGEFDLNGILGKAKSAAAREDVSMPTAPGVLPGSPVVTLPVDLTMVINVLLPVHQKQIIVLSLIKVRFQPELWSWL